MFLPRITQKEFFKTKIRSVFLEFIGCCRREIFLSVAKDSTAVLVLKAMGVSAILVVTCDAQTGAAVALHGQSSTQANSTGD